jgi:hypothetical protein
VHPLPRNQVFESIGSAHAERERTSSATPILATIGNNDVEGGRKCNSFWAATGQKLQLPPNAPNAPNDSNDSNDSND